MGLLTGMTFLSHELDNETTKNCVRYGSALVAIGLYTYSLYYLVNVLDPSREYLEYYDENGI